LPSRRLDEYFRQLGAAARSRQVDVEALLRRAVEEAVREALQGSQQARGAAAADAAGLEELRRELAELRASVEELRRAVEELAERVGGSGGGAAALSPSDRRLIEDLPRAVAEAVAAVLRRQCQQARGGAPAAAAQQPRWLRAVLEKLGSRGYLFLHELPPELRDQFDPETARKHGLVVAPLGGDQLVATREAFREFSERLRGLRTSDEYEAEAKLGRYRLLFRVLRGEGMLYYGGPSKGWVLTLHPG
jgi:hypothetical protein